MPSHPIKVERLKQHADEWKHGDNEPELVAEPFATIQSLTGRELEVAQQTGARHTHRIRFRWGEKLKDMNTQYWIVFRGKKFELTSVVNLDMRNEWFECMGVVSG